MGEDRIGFLSSAKSGNPKADDGRVNGMNLWIHRSRLVLVAMRNVLLVQFWEPWQLSVVVWMPQRAVGTRRRHATNKDKLCQYFCSFILKNYNLLLSFLFYVFLFLCLIGFQWVAAYKIKVQKSWFDLSLSQKTCRVSLLTLCILLWSGICVIIVLYVTNLVTWLNPKGITFMDLDSRHECAAHSSAEMMLCSCVNM